jgi:branched-subunit amino acid aminotransferase/4-amino-4-deoxychorismate lyase
MVTVRSSGAGLLTGVKATSYATALAAVARAEREGADDALYLGEGETVLEATMANVWWRDGDVLSTPSLATGVLPGVTRAAVAGLAAGAGYRVREGSFTLPALLRSDEAFTSSAVREIMPVVAVDGLELHRGEAAVRLQALLEAAAAE